MKMSATQLKLSPDFYILSGSTSVHAAYRLWIWYQIYGKADILCEIIQEYETGSDNPMQL